MLRFHSCVIYPQTCFKFVKKYIAHSLNLFNVQMNEYFSFCRVVQLE